MIWVKHFVKKKVYATRLFLEDFNKVLKFNGGIREGQAKVPSFLFLFFFGVFFFLAHTARVKGSRWVGESLQVLEGSASSDDAFSP